MDKIYKLSEETINQIAAGEVILDIVSALKELIENSIDAGGQKIVVEINKECTSLAVIDDGVGIRDADLPLTIERHATSKIRKTEDLTSLRTMGFRGEALSSLAAVADVSIFSLHKENEHGYLLRSIFGKKTTLTPTAFNQGTKIIASSLFENIPVRKKFQKSPKTLLIETKRLIHTFALAYPEKSFILLQDKIELENFPLLSSLSWLEKLQQRAISILGKEAMEGAATLDVEEGEKKLQGFLLSYKQAKKNRLLQKVFVNRRYVHSSLVSNSLKRAYGHQISIEAHPAFLLHLTISPQEIDVNIHPQKKELRFSSSTAVEEWIYRVCSKALFPSLSLSISSASYVPTKEENFSLPPPWILKEEAHEPASTSLTLSIPENAPDIVGIWEHFLFLRSSKEETLLGIMDLKKAKAALLWEEHKKTLHNSSQLLLLPLHLQLSWEELASFEEKKTSLESLGFSFSPIGEKEWIVEAIPSILETSAEEMIRLLLGKEISPLFFITQVCQKKERFLMQEAVAIVKALGQDESYGKSLSKEPLVVWVNAEQFSKKFGL